jgi:hypothetical protein
MKRSRFVRTVLNLCLMCITLLLGVAPSVAQSMQMTQKKSAKNSTKSVPMGAMSKMGRMTKKQRMAAAVRHADQRAAHIRKHRAEVK